MAIKVVSSVSFILVTMSLHQLYGILSLGLCTQSYYSTVRTRKFHQLLPTISTWNKIKFVNSASKVTQENSKCSFRFCKYESIAFVSTVCQINLRSECKTSFEAHVDAKFSIARSATYFRLELVECDSPLIWLFIWYFQRKASLHGKFNEAFYWKVLANPG